MKNELKGWIQIYIDYIYHPVTEYSATKKPFWHVKIFGKTILQMEKQNEPVHR